MSTQARTFISYYPNQAWSSTTAYAIGDMITSGGITYISVAYPNTGNNPTSTTGFWVQIGGSGGGGGSFTINSFTGAQAGELGQSYVNPTFSATYSTTPASAQITNTDGISSPTTLTTPFTNATVTGTFSHSSTATTTFTLSATSGSTQTANLTFTWKPRIFSGLGAAGATSSVTASGTNAILSNSASLASVQLGPEAVGQLFGPFSPSSQCVYLLLTGGSHTFTDNITGFPFAFNAPTTVTFVNQYGVTVTMYLYQSTNALTGTFQPKVAS